MPSCSNVTRETRLSCIKSPVTQSFLQQLVGDKIKEINFAPHYWPLTCGFPHKEPVMRKTFPCQDIKIFWAIENYTYPPESQQHPILNQVCFRSPGHRQKYNPSPQWKPFGNQGQLHCLCFVARAPKIQRKLCIIICINHTNSRQFNATQYSIHCKDTDGHIQD